MPHAKRTIRIWWDATVRAYRLSGAYDDQLVSFLKSNIPYSDRAWDPATKIWTFTESYFSGVEKLCKMVFGDANVSVFTRQQVEATAGATSGTSVQKVDTITIELAEFLRLLPYEAAQAAYRKAAFILHPDKGGDMEKMSRLNQLWTKIEKEVYKP